MSVLLSGGNPADDYRPIPFMKAAPVEPSTHVLTSPSIDEVIAFGSFDDVRKLLPPGLPA